MMRIARAILFGALGAAAIGMANPAFAHARLVQSTPAANTTLSAGPKTISLTFSEKLVPGFSKLTVTMPAHGMNVPVKSAVSPDGKHIVGTLSSALSSGAYKITWTAASADGHKMSGTFDFKVE
jgi:methionine-rich copper-binding protein CopC